MKVLIISLAYIPFVGGAELAVKEITDRINEIDFDLLTVNLDGKQKSVEQVGRVKVYRLGKGKIAKYFFPFAAFKKAKSLHQEKKYDVVWAVMANQAGLAALKFKKKFPQVKYLLTLQEGDSIKRIWARTWFMRPIYKRIFTVADVIQPISEFLADRAQKYGYQGRIEVVPNGVDIKKFQNNFDPQELVALKSKLNLNEKDKIVITTSRLVHKNGIDTLIKAVKDLPVKVLILGQGELETKLKSLAQELGVKDKILFLGHIDQSQLPAYLNISDVFVRASRSEGLGSSFLEALAAGVPVIATSVGGIKDFLVDNTNGLVCKVDNPVDLADKIQKIISDESLTQKLVQNGKSLVLRDYDWNQIAHRMSNILQTFTRQNF